jgi:DNA mismatch repair ATPase MutS
MVIQKALRMGIQTIQRPAREAQVADSSGIAVPAPAEIPVAAVSAAERLLRSLSKLFDDQQQKQTARADHIDRKRARELREKRQAQGHAHDEQIQSY